MRTVNQIIDELGAIALDHHFIRSFKEECIWPSRFSCLAEARHVISNWIRYYKRERPHQALGQRAPARASEKLERAA